eukprot:TRINITY_DN5602_c0_g1_i1.p1 TRINITY_DN5602_c0_g1~~TRINITY_DN5602_c0_g1_i1.p1  ORF type:complete len:169 (+),score=20.09 TRINITY_DN5602_c0_g1_i1:191-697(+)
MWSPLLSWVAERKGSPVGPLQLMYQASRDGFRSETFHRICDGRIHALVVVRSTTGWVFGGYTSVGFRTGNGHYADAAAFLFTLRNPTNTPPTKFDLKDPSDPKAVGSYSARGPIFGGGLGDLCIATDADSKDSSCRLGDSFVDSTGRRVRTFTGGEYFRAADWWVLAC